MNVSEIPETPETIIVWVGVIFAVGFIGLILYSIYKMWV